MAGTDQVLEYKCPCCGAGLKFSQDGQNMACEYCGNTFEIEVVKAYNATLAPDEFVWDNADTASWSEAEAQTMHTFQCPACGWTWLIVWTEISCVGCAASARA